MNKRTKVGIIGCGNISGTYFPQLGQIYSQYVELVACADLDFQKAKVRAGEFNVKAMTVKNILADPDIEIIVNLTIPKAHYSVAMKAVMAGKSVYNEKPLCITFAEGQRLLAAATAKGVRVGGAPDTFMGGGIQTAIKAIQDGRIGRPIAATAFMMCHGHEGWHSNPAFFYQKGGGPMFDMGPYYMTALVALLGPVKRISGSAQTTFATRTITSEPLKGQVINVEVPTHVTGIMDFVNGAVATVIMSFDIWEHHLPCIEIYGTDGSLVVPDPNGFGGDVTLFSAVEWAKSTLECQHATNINRGTGVADMAIAKEAGRPHRASGELCNHVLEIMHAFHDSSSKGKVITLKSSCAQPEPMKAGLPAGTLE